MRGGDQNGQYVFVVRLVRLAIVAALLSACSGSSDGTSRSGSTSSPTSTSQQISVVIFGDTGNAVTGHLMDGRPFVVRHDPVRGLCLTIGDTDFGTDLSCNDGAPLNLAQGAPRFSAEVQGSLLAHGYLPENATEVVGVFDDGRRVDDDVVSNSAPRVWALPLPLGTELGKRPAIFYVAADGTETRAP